MAFRFFFDKKSYKCKLLLEEDNEEKVGNDGKSWP